VSDEHVIKAELQWPR